MTSQNRPATMLTPPAVRQWNAAEFRNRRDRWCFPRDRDGVEHQPPSVPQSVPEEDRQKALKEERWSRLQCAEQISEIGKKLQLPAMCVNTAIFYMHRFYQFHSFKKFQRDVMAPVFVFLAAKVDESPRRVQDIILVNYKILNPNPTPDPLKPDTPKFQQELDDIFTYENVLLQTLAFDLVVDHPHTVVIKCCQQVLRCEKELSFAAYAIASCALQYTTLCIQYPTPVIAAMCIHIAAKWTNRTLALLPNALPVWAEQTIPLSSEGKDWFWYIDQKLALEQIDRVTKEFLAIIESYPPRIIEKIREKVLQKEPQAPPAAAVKLAAASRPDGAAHAPPASSAPSTDKKMDRGASAAGPSAVTKPGPDGVGDGRNRTAAPSGSTPASVLPPVERRADERKPSRNEPKPDDASGSGSRVRNPQEDGSRRGSRPADAERIQSNGQSTSRTKRPYNDGDAAIEADYSFKRGSGIPMVL